MTTGEEFVSMRPATLDDLEDSSALYEVDCADPVEVQTRDKHYTVVSFDEL